MSWLPKGFEAELAASVRAATNAKESKIIEANKLATADWQKHWLAWSKHYTAEKLKPYDERLPYYENREARIVIMAISSKKKIPGSFTAKDGNKTYFDSFVSGLLSDLIKEPKLVKEITIFDTKGNNSEFEAWYKRDGEWTEQRRFVRGQLTIKYRDIGDVNNKKGDWDNVYAKNHGKQKLSELSSNTYERLFTLNLWETVAFPRVKGG